MNRDYYGRKFLEIQLLSPLPERHFVLEAKSLIYVFLRVWGLRYRGNRP